MAHHGLSSSLWSFPLPDHSGLLLARPSLPGKLFILNHSASYLWSALCSLPPLAPPAQLYQPFAQHFGISLAQATADIQATLEQWSLQSLGLPHDDAITGHNSNSLLQPQQQLPATLPRWTLHLHLNGKSFRLLFYDADPALVAEIRPRLAHLLVTTPSASPDHTFHLFRSPHSPHVHCVLCNDPNLFFLSPQPDDPSIARTFLFQEIARLAYADPQQAQWLTILHAAALAPPTCPQHALLFPAATNSGKSTLSAALLHAGFHYLSDDSAAILTTGEVLPLPFALMLREGSWSVLREHGLFSELPVAVNATTLPIHQRFGEPVRFLVPPPSTIAAEATHRHPAFPKALVFLDRQPLAHSAAQLRPLNHFETLHLLQKSGFWVPHSQPSLAAFVDWITALPSYQLTYSTVTDAIKSLPV